jgi:threonyl-tRNA synthetase
MINVTFPDGSVREVPDGSSALDVAQGIGSRLAQAAIGALVNEQPYDLSRPLPGDCHLRILTFKDAEGREVYRHSSTHLMAQAVKELYPAAKLTVGPPLDDKFYYDIDVEPIREEDFARIEAKMREISERNLPIVREEVSREAARELFAGLGEDYKLEILDAIPEGDSVTLYVRAIGSTFVAARTCLRRARSKPSRS